MQIENGSSLAILYQQYRAGVEAQKSQSTASLDAASDNVPDPRGVKLLAMRQKTLEAFFTHLGGFSITPQVEKQTQILAQEFGGTATDDAAASAPAKMTIEEQDAIARARAEKNAHDPEFIRGVTEAIHGYKALQEEPMRRDYAVETLPYMRDYAIAHLDEWKAASESLGVDVDYTHVLAATDDNFRTAAAVRNNIDGWLNFPKSSDRNGTDMTQPQSTAEKIFRMIASPEDQAKFDATMAPLREATEAKIKAIEAKPSPVYVQNDDKLGLPPVTVIY